MSSALNGGRRAIISYMRFGMRWHAFGRFRDGSGAPGKKEKCPGKKGKVPREKLTICPGKNGKHPRIYYPNLLTPYKSPRKPSRSKDVES